MDGEYLVVEVEGLNGKVFRLIISEGEIGYTQAEWVSLDDETRHNALVEFLEDFEIGTRH